MQSMFTEFDETTSEVKKLRIFLLEDELLKAKEDIKSKNKEIKLIKDLIAQNENRSQNSSKRISLNMNNPQNNNSTIQKKKNINDNNDIGEMLKNIQLKVKIYNNLVNKKEKEVQGLEKHIKLLKDYNNFSKKCGENQELLCEENKIMTDEMIEGFSGLNQFIEEMKKEKEFLEQKLKSKEESRKNIVELIQKNMLKQLNIIKDRENLISQSEQINNGLKNEASQMNNSIDLLKIEKQHLKDRNYIINAKL